jgi:hypothetical protein
VRYRRIAQLAETLGRLPRRSDDGVLPADVSWVADQRRAPRLSTRQQWLLTLLPGWDEGARDGAWFKRAEDLRRFVREYGRRPRVRSADPTERALAYWYSRQHSAAEKGLLGPERVEALSYALRDLRPD